MKKSDFNFELPLELVAQEPLSERRASRLLVLDADGQVHDRKFAELRQWLSPGDLLVLNDTRVMPARLFAKKDSGGAVEILIERIIDDHRAHAQARAAKPLRPGQKFFLEDGTAIVVLERAGEFHALRFETTEPIEKLLLRLGHMPLPPYIRRSDTPQDAERYQTVYAKAPGAVAAPTAGLHFDADLLGSLAQDGIAIGHITLHVGAGTFQPLRTEDIREHRMHGEWLNVGAELVAKVRAVKKAGKRVIAVGTTVVRALESAAVNGELHPHAGETQIFIFPGYRFCVVDALITNFHVPQSTLLMLVCAFAGKERVLAAYQHAIAQRYRFYSYGDAMLVFPGQGAA